MLDDSSRFVLDLQEGMWGVVTAFVLDLSVLILERCAGPATTYTPDKAAHLDPERKCITGPSCPPCNLAGNM